MSNITIEDVLSAYIAKREQKKKLEDELEEKLKPLNEAMEKIETWLLARMQEDGVDSYKTSVGTAYKTNKCSVQIADPGMFKNFVFEPLVKTVMEQYNIDLWPLLAMPQWNLVDFRALKKGVEVFIEDTSSVPPGLNVSRTATVNVRRK